MGRRYLRTGPHVVQRPMPVALDLSVRLPGGRRLGFAEYGAASGEPLLFFPGTPHSRWSAPTDERWLAQGGIRFFTVERPGFGISDYQPDRRLLDWPCDVASFADRLGVGRFWLAGTSSGGPYVAACAYAIPERVRAAAIVAGGGPVDAPDAMIGMAFSRRSATWLFRHAPAALEQFGAALPLHRRPDLVYGYMARALRHEPAALDAGWDERMKDVAEALRPGLRGFLRELRIFASPWGFPLEDIRAEVHIWHGDADRATPLGMGRNMAARIPGARAHIVRGGGHLLWQTHQREILEGLIGQGRCGSPQASGVHSL